MPIIPVFPNIIHGIEINDFKNAEQVIKLIDMLEDDDDIKSVHSNLEIGENIMENIG